MKILIISPELPYPRYKNGRTSTLYSLIEQWKTNSSIMLLVADDCDPDGEKFFDINNISVSKLQAKKRLLIERVGERVFIKPRNLWHYSYSCDQIKLESDYDLIILFGFESILHYDKICAHGAKVVFFELDCLSLLYRRLYKNSVSFLSKVYYLTQFILVEYIEKYYYSIVDHVFFVSPSDKDYCRSKFHLQNPDVFASINNGVDPIEKCWQSNHDGRCINVCFSGNFSYEPNKLSALFILDRILPCLSELPIDFVFHLVGSNPPHDLIAKASRWGPKVIVTGFVDDIDDYLSDMDIYVSPLFIGTGMKNKILQAMNIGIPLICTDISIDGIPEMKNDVNCIVCNDTDGGAWAQKIFDMSRCHDKAAVFSKKTREIIEARYRWHQMAAEFMDIIYRRDHSSEYCSCSHE